ncbi:MAG: glycosyltransferase [Patescibacteria group bacterium]
MKKLLYIITIPDWGGAQKYVFQEALANKDGSEVFVFAGRSDKFKSKINLLNELAYHNEEFKSNIKTGQLNHLVRPISPLNDLLVIFELAKIYNSIRPNTVNLNSSKAGILGSFAKIFSKHKPQITYTVHGWVFLEPMNPLKKWLYIILERLASRWRDKIIVLGEKERQIALDYKICEEKKLEIIPHRAPSKLFLHKEESRKELNLPLDKKVIGTVANFYPVKGLEYLIKAAAKINHPDAVFAIIGDGPERKKIEQEINNLRLNSRIFLLGEKENAAQYLKAFDLFVLPSIKEGAPYVILEAMAAGLPIVATSVGNISEMLKDYKDKIIIPPANTDVLAKAILKKI